MSRQAIAALLAGLAALAFVVMRRKAPVADVAVDAPANALPLPSPKVRSFAEAVARAEGFYASGATIPARAKNPGDLKLGDKGRGTINGITIFESVDQGFAALYRQLSLIAQGKSAYYRPTMTIRQMGDTWAPPVDRNVPGAWSQIVANQLGVSVDTSLSRVLV